MSNFIGNRSAGISRMAQRRGTIGCVIVIVLIVICFACYSVVQGPVGTAPDIRRAGRITREFIEALQNERINTAYKLLSEEVRTQYTQDDLVSMAAEKSIQGYQDLEVCRILVRAEIIGNKENVVTASGLYEYEDSVVVFESNLHQDSDGAWRLAGFHLKPDVEPTPFGTCR